LSAQKGGKKMDDVSQNKGDDVKTIVSPNWLNTNLQRKDISIFDATWGLNKTDSYDDFLKSHIPGAQYFPIDKIADTSVDLPHMLPSVSLFESAMATFGLKNSDHVVVYDRSGQYVASARVWWTFRIFGHKKVSVLEGGLPHWNKNKFPLESGPSKQRELSAYRASFQKELVQSFDEMVSNMKKKSQIVDARSKGRFIAVDPEPRPHLRGGHIPGSKSLPFGEILTKKDVSDEFTVFQSPEKLKEIFLNAGIDPTKPVTASCGSGVTASVLALGLHLTGSKNYSVYDGSWSEWGLPSLADKAPVATDIDK